MTMQLITIKISYEKDQKKNNGIRTMSS